MKIKYLLLIVVCSLSLGLSGEQGDEGDYKRLSKQVLALKKDLERSKDRWEEMEDQMREWVREVSFGPGSTNFDRNVREMKRWFGEVDGKLKRLERQVSDIKSGLRDLERRVDRLDSM